MRFENVAKIQHYPLKNNRPVGESSRGVGAASEVKQPTFGRLAGPAAQRGFTIVELLIVIVVIAILAAISIVTYRGVTGRTAETVLKSDLRQAATQLEADRAWNGEYPPSKEAADGNKGLPKSDSTNYEYTYTAATDSYCLTATSTHGGVPAFFVSSESGSINEGTCPGHQGPIGGDDNVALNCPSGFIVVPGNSTYGTSDFCVMKYEAKNVGGVPTSQASGTPWVSISQTSAISQAQNACDGCQLITEAQWMTIAANVMSVGSNWSGGSVGSGYIYSGHNDSSPANSLAASSNDSNGYEGTGNTDGNQRRTLTLTNGEVIWDFAGNVWEWTQGTITGGQPGLSGESAFAWKDYNNASLQWNSLPSVSRPTGTLYPRSQGVGGLYSNAGDSSARAFFRGGGWGTGSGAGVLTLYLNGSPYHASASFGFRVSR